MKVKTDKVVEIDITKEDFLDYKRVQDSGKTNMFDLTMVVHLSDNLTKEKVMAIIKNYEILAKEYLE